MKVIFAFLILTSSIAFAGEKISLNIYFGVSKCSLQNGEEFCTTTVNIPDPNPNQNVYEIDLKKSDDGTFKEGKVFLTEETEVGVFHANIYVKKIQGQYFIESEFVDPDWISYLNPQISFNRISEIKSTYFEGPIWSLGNGEFYDLSLSIEK